VQSFSTPSRKPVSRPAPKPASTQSFGRKATSLMEWSDAFVLGIQEIDDQHKKLVNLVNELNAAMKSGKGVHQLAKVFEELKEYTVHHFATEEALFEEHNYPGMISHIAIHKKLVGQVLELEEKFKNNSGVLTTDVMNFLKDWLVKHIQGEDRKYVPHLLKAGVSPYAGAASVAKASPVKKPSPMASGKPASLMEWSDAFVIDIEEIDYQHKKLVDLVNQLNAAMKTGRGKDKLAQVFEDLKEYTVHHFATEEALFEEHNYPGMISHVALHKKLVDQVIELEEKFKSNSGVLTTDVMNFLKDWLIKHIQGEDRKYVPHLHKAGVK